MAGEVATTEHRFEGVRPVDPEDYSAGWTGHCACGHATEPGDKDETWDAIGQHILHAPGGLWDALRAYRAERAKLN